MTRNELIKLWAKVTGKFDALIAGAPEALDTLKEIADKLSDDDDALAGLLSAVAGKANAADVYTKSEIGGIVDDAEDWMREQLAGKQDALVSGQNIKTVNNESLLGSGNVTIAGGEDGKSAYQSYVDTTTDSPVKTEAEWVASLKGDQGIGFESASSPATADGTWQITLTNGDTVTIDLNHVHPQYETVSPITNAASGALTVNEYRDFGTVSALTVTLSGGTMANYDLYKFAFTCASDSTTLTLPSDIKLPVDMEMEMATGRRFECVIDYANCLTFNCWD